MSRNHTPGVPAAVLLAGLLAAAPSGGAAPERRGSPEQVARRLIDALGPSAAPAAVEVADAGPGGTGCYLTRDPGGGVRVRVTPRLLEELRGDDDALAFLVARELGHAALSHLRGQPAGAAPAFTREQELAADLYGAELILRAGFSYRKAAQGVARLLGPGPANALAAPAAPPWAERAEHL